MESEGFGVSDDVCPKSVLGCCQVLLYNCRCSSSFFLGTVFGVVVRWTLAFSASLRDVSMRGQLIDKEREKGRK